jgi:hypothetical protein
MKQYKNLMLVPFFLGSTAIAKEKPNILWVTIEDTSPQFVGCMAIKMPELRSLRS